MSFEIDFDNPLIRRQDLVLTLDPDAFRTELAPARTFGLLDDVAAAAGGRPWRAAARSTMSWSSAATGC